MNSADFPNLPFAQALETLAAMPAVLEAAIAGASAQQLKQRGADEGFSLTEQACHLRDLEREGYAVRLTRMLTESRPTLAGFQGDMVARERDYLSQDAHMACHEFAMARGRFLEVARSLTAEQMQRTGEFAGRTITVCHLLAMMVDHDSGHRREIEALTQWK